MTDKQGQEYTVSYPFLRAWHKTSGSFDYYIDNLIAQAEKENAPQRAIYKATDGRWRTFDDIEVPAVWIRIIDYVNLHYLA